MKADYSIAPACVETPATPGRWRDWHVIALLMLATLALRGWQIAQTTVVSRDSIAFIQYAWQLDQQPWDQVVRKSVRHPGYPVAVWAVAQTARPFSAAPDTVFMQAAAQWTSALASVLLVIPVYLLARSWFGRGAACAAVVLSQFVPAGGVLLGDGLSEALFLLLAVSSVYAADRGLSSGSIGMLTLCGLGSGLAYLVRPEGLALAGAAGLVLLLRQLSRTRRLGWTRWATASACLTLATAVAAAPLVLTCGKLTPKPTVRVLANTVVETKPKPRKPGSAAQANVTTTSDAAQIATIAAKAQATPTPKPIAAMPTATPPVWSRLTAALGQVGHEMLQGFLYYLWAPVLLAGACHWRAIRPAGWVLLIAVGLIAALLVAVSFHLDYVSERHLALVLLAAVLPAAAGVVELGQRLGHRLGVNPNGMAVVLVALAATPLLVKGVKPLHAERLGYREAGAWLAEHSRPDDVIVDPHCWASYYAGRCFVQPQASAGRDPERRVYVVLDRASAQRSRLAAMPAACSLAERGTVVFAASPDTGKKPARVEVFALPAGEGL